ncbi:hypothetical protein HanIR_Chr03g0116451 [Helianthus annuus]|nr:hypothetical protein HanIR_Chr03g0116451 [Helianthus annuus]
MTIRKIERCLGRSPLGRRIHIWLERSRYLKDLDRKIPDIFEILEGYLSTISIFQQGLTSSKDQFGQILR